MLKQYRNNLLQIIQEQGLNPRLFQSEENELYEKKAFEITLKDSPMKFIVRNNPGNFHKFIWNYTYFEPEYHMVECTSFENKEVLYATFSDWLQNHVKPYIYEITEPDMWTHVESETPLINGSEITEEGTSTFSDDEKIRIRMSINEFRLVIIKNFEPTKEELKIINARLEYLADSVDRLNKLDWRSIAFTTLIAISTALALDTEKGQLLFDLFKQVFSNLLQLMQ